MRAGPLERCIVGMTATASTSPAAHATPVVTVTHLSPVLGPTHAPANSPPRSIAAGGGVLELALSKGLLEPVQARADPGRSHHPGIGCPTSIDAPRSRSAMSEAMNWYLPDPAITKT